MSNRDVKEILDDIRYSEELLAMEDLQYIPIPLYKYINISL